MRIKNYDHIIIGGGIQGTATAFFLSRRGEKVILFEKDKIAQHASGLNAGGIRTLGRKLEEIPLSILSMEYWNKIEKILGKQSLFFKSNYIKVTKSQNDLKKAQKRIELLENSGFYHEICIDKKELKKYVSNISDSYLGGVLVEGNGWAKPYEVVSGFIEKAMSFGAKVFENTKVLRCKKVNSNWIVETSSGLFSSPRIINCAGAWGAEIAKILGDEFKIKAYAPMLILTNAYPKTLKPILGILDKTLSLKQIDTGQFLIGGGAKAKASLKQNSSKLNFRGINEMFDNAKSVIPNLETAKFQRIWSGIEGYFPDNLPVIGYGSKDGILHAFGFSAHGFQLGPAVGELLADLSMNRQSRLDISKLSPSRFVS